MKNSGILLLGRSQIQKQHLWGFLSYPSTILHTAYRKQFYTEPLVPMKSWESEGVPFANQESVTKHLADIGP